MSSYCGQALYSPDWQETYSDVTAIVGSKRRMIEVESNFINGSFEIQKQQSEVKGLVTLLTESRIRPSSTVEQRRSGTMVLPLL